MVGAIFAGLSGLSGQTQEGWVADLTLSDDAFTGPTGRNLAGKMRSSSPRHQGKADSSILPSNEKPVGR